ncbi:MAG: AAA family ATPase [Selenomonadaceae bacterium]|nr:AAA family ATPase [Selenomonadaceae bacterium]
MGVYLNPGDDKFLMAIQSEIYVDKSEILSRLNCYFRTESRFICVSRPRRFGKSMTANMVVAYYDRTVNAAETFKGLKIVNDTSFEKHCNAYDVIQVNMQDFLSRTNSMDEFLRSLKKRLLFDLLKEYSDIDCYDPNDLIETMSDIYANTNRPFVIIIDEWDAVFREYKGRKDWQEKYLDFLRAWLKDKNYVGLAYMTGILPIKKYGTHSALNMFNEFSMENPGKLAEFVGFTKDEVEALCKKYNVNYEECKAWYDGYSFAAYGVKEVYNPRSVVCAMENGVFDNYWNKTETFEALKIYIDLNFDGLKEAIIALMSGEHYRVNTKNFTNDMSTFNDKDDVLTLLIHLGYLGYDFNTSSVFIPNQEVLTEYANSVRSADWQTVAEAVKTSEELLESALSMNSEKVAEYIDSAHLETSYLTYNDENALAYTISLAFYTARRKYLIVREFPTGKGFADIVYLPRPTHLNLPAMIVELKWDKSAKTAIRQIKEKQYIHALKDYTGKVLLVGINYDKTSRKHSCEIEEFEINSK